MEILIWLGIIFCASKAAMFSGLNLAYFSVPNLRLSILASDDKQAEKVLELRQNSNRLLATILWGNVAYNVLLTLLTNSVLTGLMSFLFSTVVLTLVGEILPQATFSRSALKFGAFFAPVIRFYQVLLYPIAQPTAWVLTQWLGPLRPDFYEEADLASFIQVHMDRSYYGDISPAEGKGSMAFLKLDDTPLKSIGHKIESTQIKALSPHFLNKKIDEKSDLLTELLKQKHDFFIITNQHKKPIGYLDLNRFIANLQRGGQPLSIKSQLENLVVRQETKDTAGDILPLCSPEKTPKVLYWRPRQKRLITAEDLWKLLV